MYWLVGLLQLNSKEPLWVGDPCYFDFGYDCLTVAPEWGNDHYPVFVEYDADIFGRNRPTKMVLSLKNFDSTKGDHPLEIPKFDLSKERPLTWLNVDSGQMAFCTEQAMSTWTENVRCDFDNPQCDYDHVGHVTLRTLLRAGIASKHVLIEKNEPAYTVGSVVVSRTNYGDGSYPIYMIRAKNNSLEHIVIDFLPKGI